jgi:hypothetical protein
MQERRNRWLRPVIIVSLVSLPIPAIALAQTDSKSNAQPSVQAFYRGLDLTVLPAILGGPAPARHTLRDAAYYRHKAEARLARFRERQAVQRRKARIAAKKAAAARAAAAVSAAAPAPVSYSGANWIAIASCESSGRWSLNSGNGFWGGLQFTPETWFAYGGGPFSGYGPFPYSAAAQIAVGERVLASQGPSAWPHCFVWA